MQVGEKDELRSVNFITDFVRSATGSVLIAARTGMAVAIAGLAVEAFRLAWDQRMLKLPVIGRTFFGAHLSVERPTDPLLSGWHAVNCIREWRGDTHWALVAAAGLDGPQASILHNAYMRYEGDWLAELRGAMDAVATVRAQGPVA